MNAVKQQALLQGQTGLARKVFECVPMQEAWTLSQIQTVLRQLGSSGSQAEAHVIRGCLGELEDQRLVRQPKSGLFQRVKTQEKDVTPVKGTAVVSTIAAKPANTPMELLGELSGELVALSDEFGKRFKGLARRIEEAAITIEQDREASGEKLAKLEQLQTLLKSLS
jgi:hypothetical protein